MTIFTEEKEETQKIHPPCCLRQMISNYPTPPLQPSTRFSIPRKGRVKVIVLPKQMPRRSVPVSECGFAIKQKSLYGVCTGGHPIRAHQGCGLTGFYLGAGIMMQCTGTHSLATARPTAAPYQVRNAYLFLEYYGFAGVLGIYLLGSERVRSCRQQKQLHCSVH